MVVLSVVVPLRRSRRKTRQIAKDERKRGRRKTHSSNELDVQLLRSLLKDVFGVRESIRGKVSARRERVSIDEKRRGTTRSRDEPMMLREHPDLTLLLFVFGNLMNKKVMSWSFR